MVTTIVLLLCFSLAFIAGGFIAFKGVQLGLRWQIETKAQQPPTLDSPIQPIIEHREQKEQLKQAEEQTSILHEYLNGADEG